MRTRRLVAFSAIVACALVLAAWLMGLLGTRAGGNDLRDKLVSPVGDAVERRSSRLTAATAPSSHANQPARAVASSRARVGDPYVIRGFVVDQRNARLPNWVVRCYPKDFDLPEEDITSMTGEFQFEDKSADEYFIEVFERDALASRPEGAARATRATSPITIQVLDRDRATCAVSGFVADVNGFPIPDAKVELVDDSQDSFKTRSMPDGGFMFDRLQDGDYSIRIAHPNYEAAAFPKFHLDKPRNLGTLGLTALATVVVRLRYPSGVDERDAVVSLWSCASRDRAGNPAFSDFGGAERDEWQSKNVPRGDYVTVAADRSLQLASEAIRISVPGGERVHVELVMVKAHRVALQFQPPPLFPPRARMSEFRICDGKGVVHFRIPNDAGTGRFATGPVTLLLPPGRYRSQFLRDSVIQSDEDFVVDKDWDLTSPRIVQVP